MTEAEEKLKRLYNMVEDGMTDIHDILKERFASRKRDRDRAKVAVYIKSVVDQSRSMTAFRGLSKTSRRLNKPLQEKLWLRKVFAEVS